MKFRTQFLYLAILISMLAASCSENTGDEEPVLFESLPPSQTGIQFENNLFPTEEFNMYAFRSFYNGGGVAVGDLNNDGLPDIFFTGNMVSNRFYLNRGDFQFEDVTEQAGLLTDGVWSAGVSFADVNGDGLLDIYITKSGRPGGERRHNELFINMGIPENGNTDIPFFEERSAEYGLDVTGLSTQAVFFDYDGDSDLDMYLLNTSFDSIGGYENITGEARQTPDPEGGDKLFRNELISNSSDDLESSDESRGFTDVTDEAGIYSSRIAFGLSSSVADVNRDGWPDIYVANDFFERDYLYINNRDGTFREVLEEQMNSISLSSMGSDIADLTNNGWPDIYVADMYPHSESRKKTKMRYETYSEYQQNVNKGFHHQVTRNTLQLNLGNDPENHDLPLFSEIGRLSGVEASDWSWAVLLADYDHNGHTDIYVTNGIYKDLLDQDYIHYMADPNEIRGMIQSDRDDVIMTLMERIPSVPQPNFLFSGEGESALRSFPDPRSLGVVDSAGGLRFTNRSEAWGLARPGFSSGAAWGDLNGDGSLDLVVNDVNGPARVYGNRATELHPERGRLFVKLQGQAPNTQAIGSQLEVWANGDYWYREHVLQRGFQSSVAPGLHIGLGDGISRIDSLRLRWPDGRITRMQNIDLPARLTLEQSEAGRPEPIIPPGPLIPGDLTLPGLHNPSRVSNPGRIPVHPLLEDITGRSGIKWSHHENDFNDFNRERLLVNMRSTEGPPLCTGDVNGDGLEDLHIGGARGQAGALLIQNDQGGFATQIPQVFEDDKSSEDTDCVMFDANGDGHTDLYVTSGGNSFSSGSSALADRLYFGDGDGNFALSEQILPTRQGFITSSSVAVGDMTGNGAPDLFVGERLRLFAVGMPARGILLENDGQGNFTEVTSEWAPKLDEAGMITDAAWTDWDSDGREDLVVVGEWMSPRFFRNTGNSLEEITGELGLSDLTGWWNAVHVSDLNGDNRPDLVLGNHGLNSQFRATKEHPVRMWVGDFEGNGMVDQILSMPSDNKDYPVALRHELLEQIPSLGEAYPDYVSYGGETVQDLLSEEQREKALVLEATELASVVVWNEPDEPRVERLSLRAQLSSVYGIWSGDLTCDGYPEILTVGNLLEVKPVVGPYDASYGEVITQDAQGTMGTLSQMYSGFKVNGVSRRIQSLTTGSGSRLIVVARNNQPPKVFKADCADGFTR